MSSCSAARNDAGVGARVAHRGEPGLGQRVINDEYVHGAQPTGQSRSTVRTPRRIAVMTATATSSVRLPDSPAPADLPARAARRRPGGRGAAGGRARHPLDQDHRQGPGHRPGDPDGRPDHPGGRRHPGQGARAVRQGAAPRPGRPDLPARSPRSASTRRWSRSPPRCCAAPACTWPAWPPRSRPARRRWTVKLADTRGRGRGRRRRDRHGDQPGRVPGRATTPRSSTRSSRSRRPAATPTSR